MKRLRLEEEKKPINKIIRLLKIGGGLLIMVLILEIWVANRLSTYGDKIEQIKSSQAALELENQILENKIAQKTSLGFIEKEAQEYGFSNMKNVEYFKFQSLAAAF